MTTTSRRRVRPTFRSMKVRNFRLFFVGQAVSQVGNWLTLVAQTLLVLHLTDSGVAVGVLAACQFLPVLLFGAWAGLVADRSDKRKLLMIVQSFAMVQSFALPALAFMDQPPIAGALRRRPRRRRSPLRSTTRPAERSWSRWCPTTTCRTPSA